MRIKSVLLFPAISIFNIGCMDTFEEWFMELATDAHRLKSIRQDLQDRHDIFIRPSWPDEKSACPVKSES